MRIREMRKDIGVQRKRKSEAHVASGARIKLGERGNWESGEAMRERESLSHIEHAAVHSGLRPAHGLFSIGQFSTPSIANLT